MPMTTAVKAIYEDGVFKPLEPLHLDELTPVEVLIPCPAAEDLINPGGLECNRRPDWFYSERAV
jgi:hypothetical protein